ncbi:MAG: response regulator [bacterium]|nr:response regulator [bacterium]
MKKRFYCPVIIIIILVFFSSRGFMFPVQEKPGTLNSITSTYIIDTWEQEDGLPQNSIPTIIQTRDGYIWLGTMEGAARFNGKKFKVFDMSNTKVMSSHSIVSLLEDHSGVIWMGTADGKLLRLENGLFTAFPISKGSSLDEIRALCRYRKDVLLVGSRGDGAYLVQKDNISPFHLPEAPFNNDIRAITMDHEGNTWFGTSGNGILKKDAKTGNFTNYARADGLPCLHIKVIFEDRQENIWVGTGMGGFCLYHPEKESFEVFDTSHGLPDDHVRVIGDDRNGNLWIGTQGGGLCRFRDGRFSVLNSSNGLLSDNVAAFLEDREGNLWFGSSGGGLIRLKHKKITVLDKSTGLSSDTAFPIIEDSRGTLYIGTNKGVEIVRNGKVTLLDTSSGLTSNRVFSLFMDKDNGLWIGTYGGGVNYLKNGKIKSITKKDGLSDNFVWPVFVDSGGITWVGTEGKGLNRIEDGEIIVFNTGNGLSSNRVTLIFEDSGKNLWVGTYGGGLNRIKNRKITVLNDSNGLANNIVLSMYEETNGTLWVGTEVGISRLKNGNVTTFRKKDGLFNNLIYQILGDDQGNLWMSCNRGIFRVSLQELNDFAEGRIKRVKSVTYGKDDGMKSLECNGICQPAGIKTRDGKLLFPTLKGVVIIDPRVVGMNMLPPPVVIEKVLVDRLPYNPDVKASLEPGSRDIEIHYAGLSYNAPESVKFLYTMEGYEKIWHDPGTHSTAYYMNLPAGSYKFRVKACNNDGIWNETGASFEFTMTPYFYQTRGFYHAATFLLILLGMATYTIRVRAFQRNKRELEKLVDHRTDQLKNANTELEKLLRNVREANKAAQNERQAAESANRSKGEFLARMSHEIRTPMNSIIGFAEMLMDTDMTEEQDDYAGTISRSGEALISILDDILDFSKNEAGKLSLEPIDFNPEITAFDVCELILPRIGSKPIEVLCRVNGLVPSFVKQDLGRFRQVLTNLMGNAAKFTEEGEIELSITVEKEELHHLKLLSIIRDTGIGIPAEQLDTIFEVFQQADGSITRKFGGTGLGLAISKQIANCMRGDISVESIPGKGSTFFFHATVEKSAKESAKENGTQELKRKRILIVDNNQNNLDILALNLERDGLQVVKLTDGKKVVSTLLENLNNNTPVDLCILDIRMPGFSGYDVAEQIRTADPGSPIPALPLLAICSSTEKQTRKFQKYGFDGFLPKPVRRHKLLRILKRLLEKGKAVEKKSVNEKTIIKPTPQEVAKRPTHILLAEANPLNQKLARYMLTKAGYRLEVVENGRAAVEKIISAKDAFDLVFMDIHMPEMDGREATKMIREKGFADIPIIAMTADSMKGDREKCLAAGMNDYIAKPIKRGIVFAMIKKWLEN